MATIAENLQTIKDAKEEIREAIVEKGVACDKSVPLTEYAEKIEEIESSEEYQLVEKVDFYDYDGTLIKSYTKEEALALDELPANPTHEGLIAQGWNWTLEEIKTQCREVGGIVNVGQMYTTDDGKTRIYIRTGSNGESVNLAFSQNSADAVEIDWGDGSDSETYGKYGDAILTHTYSTHGSFVIKMTVLKQVNVYLGSNASGNIYLLGSQLQNQLIDRIEIDANITAIRGDYLLSYSSIRAISLPNTTYFYGSNLFANCYNLKCIVLKNNIDLRQDYMFDGNYNLETVCVPAKLYLSRMDNYLFRNCYKLKSITIPYGTTAVGYAGYNAYLFASTLQLSQVVFPATLTSCGKYLFYSAAGLKYVKYTGSKLLLADNIYNACSSLETVEYPSGTTITTINENAFSGCTKLKNFIIPNTVTAIAANAFASCSNLKISSLHEGLISIASGAFLYCEQVETLRFPSSLTSLVSCFGRSGLTSVWTSDTLTTIPSNIFNSCNHLESVHFHENVTSIGNYIFMAAYNIKNLYMHPLTPPTLTSKYFFSSVTKIYNQDFKIHVPAESLEAYQTAENWSNYADYMVGDL